MSESSNEKNVRFGIDPFMMIEQESHSKLHMFVNFCDHHHSTCINTPYRRHRARNITFVFMIIIIIRNVGFDFVLFYFPFIQNKIHILYLRSVLCYLISFCTSK